MKFIHTADWHLGYRQYGMSVREADFLKPLDEIKDIAVRERVDAVVVSGDMFDSIHPPASAVLAARKFGEQLGEFDIPVLSIDGNHDLTGGRWAMTCGFTPVGRNAAEDTYVPADVKGVRFAGINYCRTQQLLERLTWMEERRVDLHGGVLMLHMEIAELTAYSTALSIRDLESHLDALNVGYVALGHIHNSVGTSTDSGTVYRYPGSTEMNDVSELGLKTVDLVTAENGVYTRETLGLRTREFKSVDIESVEDIDAKLVPMLNDRETFWLVKVNLGAPGKPVERVEEVMKDRLYRIIPYGSRTIEERTSRANVVIGLKDAISRFFDPSSDEAGLISRMLDTPEQVKAIAQAYLDGTDKQLAEKAEGC